ncbi:MAG: SIMPL domain-containing protein [Myxococcota bacterium]
MSASPTSPRPAGRVLVSVVLGLAFVAAAALLAGAFRHKVDVETRNVIRVAGSATVRVTSDRAMWSAVVSARGDTLQGAYAVLADHSRRTRAALVAAGVEDAEITVESVRTEELHPRHPERGYLIQDVISGYALSQRIRVTSDDVERVTRVSHDVTTLIEEGVSIRSQAPEYLFSELGDVKIRLVGEATENARLRAEQVAENTGASLGALLDARVGVIQVNAANETRATWDGVNDRRSIDKDVMVVVRTRFALD